jgi:hypothetical protein
MIADQHGALLRGADQPAGAGPAGDFSARVGGPMPVAIGPGIGRVVEQILERLAIGPSPFEAITSTFSVGAYRHKDTVMDEISEQPVKRPLTLELVEDQADGGLDLCHRALQNQPLVGASKPATILTGFGHVG